MTALHLLGQPAALPRAGLLDFLAACLHDNGGFGAAPGHDAHMLSTVSAVQILSMLSSAAAAPAPGDDSPATATENDNDDDDAFLALARRRGMPDVRRRIARWIAALQRPDGTFVGDAWGETDTRFLYGALNALSLLCMLPAQQPPQSSSLESASATTTTTDPPPLIDVPAAVAHVRACQNADGGFGVRPGDESHAGQVFTCLGALRITGSLDAAGLGEGSAGRDRLAAWLSERQQAGGGLNGRPEKLVDVCYSWWVIASLAMLDRLHWIDKRQLTGFILACQDAQRGGLADRPGDMVDVFHTNFGVAGLSLLGYEGVAEVDPV